MIKQSLLDEYKAQGFTHAVVAHRILADTLTPVSVYQKLGADENYSYLLESIEGHERWARFSVVGLPASEQIIAKNGVVEHYVDFQLKDRIKTNPLDWINGFYENRKVANLLDDLPFSGGLVGYFGYDCIGYIEKRLAKRPEKDVLDVPDMLFLVSDMVVVMDNLKGEANIVMTADLAVEDADSITYKMNRIVQKLSEPSPQPLLKLKEAVNDEPLKNADFEMGKEVFIDAVKKIKEYIIAGDVMQVVPSHRLSVPYYRKPLDLYRALRITNPSPYMYILNMKDHHIVGSSPEILVRLENRHAIVRPIAGTRKRGKTVEEDLMLEKDLLADEKELAEHAMLIDLGRNDIGRIAKSGAVKITEKMIIERYSHVMHIVSNVEGDVRENVGPVDVFKSTFPAGTLSGSSKVRAMEIIDEVETSRRGIYGGAIGYISWKGNMDLAIAIRTGVIKDNRLYVQAGAGVVYDSDPQAEWEETLNKLAALLKAIALLD